MCLCNVSIAIANVYTIIYMGYEMRFQATSQKSMNIAPMSFARQQKEFRAAINTTNVDA